MAKREKKRGPGVPEWVVTYGDMMSLLLCFFILLAAFSELKKEHEYQRVITAVKEAFGYSGGVGVMPTDDPPLRSMIRKLETLSSESLKESKVSDSSSEGVKGKQDKVSKTPEGLMFTIGGGLLFEHGSAELKRGGRGELLRVADLLGGRRNRISVRGHAAKAEGVGADADPFDLAFARAKAVRDVLVGEGGLRAELVSIESRGDSDPITARAYTAEQQADNRRVEVIMTEHVVADDAPVPEPPAESGSALKPG